ncbi:MAG: AIR synthase-related protein, partial [Pseudomonadota bacterium]
SARAMTDVTGFGLAGHLLAMLRASGASATLKLGAIPLLPGALDLAEAGTRSTLFEANKRRAPLDKETPRANLLQDPQTSGGLLAALPAAEAEGCVSRLRSAGYHAAHIGQITQGPPRITLS